MDRLLLVRHAPPLVMPGAPPQTWRLGAKARLSILALAREAQPYAASRVITSEERKARETGMILAEALGLPCETYPGLHEHEREPADFFASDGEFQQAMRTFFAQPDRLTFGRETAAAARKRFTEALASLAIGHPGETLMVVSHGTVISLAVALWTGRDAFAFWQRLATPALVVAEWPANQHQRAQIRVWPEIDERSE